MGETFCVVLVHKSLIGTSLSYFVVVVVVVDFVVIVDIVFVVVVVDHVVVVAILVTDLHNI